MKLVVFEWADASLHGQETKWKGDKGDFRLVTLISAGLVVRETDTEITLCMDYAPEEHSWRSTATYPKCCFKWIKYIPIRRKK